MSKFIDDVVMSMTHQQRVDPIPHLTTDLKLIKDPSAPYMDSVQQQYVMKVEYGYSVWAYPQDTTPLLKNFARQLSQHVYGELTRHINRLEQALYERDLDTAKSIMRDILEITKY